MGIPTTKTCAKGEWTKIATAVANIEAYNAITRAKYYMIYLPTGTTAPTDLTNASPIFLKSDRTVVDSGRLVDVYIWAINIAGSLVVYDNTGINQNSFLFNRPVTENGLPNGNYDLAVDGSETPVDFYIEALEGERLSVARFLISIRSATNIGVNEYGDLAELSNGLYIYFYDATTGLTLDLIYPLSIKRNEDWGRWCYDSQPIAIGPTQNTQTWQARWTLAKYNPKNPYGIVMEEGDRIGVRIRDDLSGLAGHTVIAEGTHLASPSPAWLSLA